MPHADAGGDVTFSVVVTFYNQRDFVADALDSVLAQSRENVEVIAVDDGSADGTADAIRAYEGSVKTVLHETNRGPSSARNSGAAEATGEYLIFLDGDDAFLPWAFDVYDTVARARRPSVVFGALRWFEGALPPLGEEPGEIGFVEYADYFKKDRSLGAWAGGTAIARRAFIEAGQWDPDVLVCEDYDLIWRLGLYGPVVYVTEPATALHRVHPGQTTQHGARMLQGITRLAELERSGKYPGRGTRAIERKACVGGCILYWAASLRRQYPRQTAALVVRNLPLIAAAAAVRVRAIVRGRAGSRTMPLAARRQALQSSP